MIILASASPRRAELLKQLGIRFEIKLASIQEEIFADLSPSENVMNLARQKALAVVRQCPLATVIGADTIVIKDAKILGKPNGKKQAYNMLKYLSDGWHSVYTGVCVVREKPILFFEETKVHMKKIEEWEIKDYIETGEPFDKAGGYGIQGQASKWIDKIDGDYFNVVGLPISHLYDVLKENGSIQ